MGKIQVEVWVMLYIFVKVDFSQHFDQVVSNAHHDHSGIQEEAKSYSYLHEAPDSPLPCRPSPRLFNSALQASLGWNPKQTQLDQRPFLITVSFPPSGLQRTEFWFRDEPTVLHHPGLWMTIKLWTALKLMLKVKTEFSRKQQLGENKTIAHLYATKLTLVNKPVTWRPVWKPLSGRMGKGKMEELESFQHHPPTSASQ